MAVLKSPGQKRAAHVKRASYILLIVITAIAAVLLSYSAQKNLAWTEDHVETMGVLTELTAGPEQVAGDETMGTNASYYARYAFNAEGVQHDALMKINYSVYSEMKEGENVVVWYQNGKPEMNELASSVLYRKRNNTPLRSAIKVLPFTLGATFVLYWLLSALFARERKEALPEGFYTENSWLDVKNSAFVAIDNGDVVGFGINKHRIAKAQAHYQEGASIDELVTLSKATGFFRMPVASIKTLISHHNGDSVLLHDGERAHSVTFLTLGLKTHALTRLKRLLPEGMVYEKKESTRLAAVLPACLLAIMMVLAMYVIDQYIATGMLLLVLLVKVLPAIVSRWLEPTVTEVWSADNEQ